MKAIEQLRTWMEAQGMRQVDLAGELGTTKVRVSRFLSGHGGLPAEQLAALEKLTGLPGLSARLGVEAPRPRKAKGRRAAPTPSVPPSAPEPPASTVPPPEEISANARRFLGRVLGVATVTEDEDDLVVTVEKPLKAVVLAGMLRLALTAKGEATRQRALADLRDWAFGKPTQRVVDLTPRPPAENAELLLVLRQLDTTPVEAKPAAPAAPVVPDA